MPRRKLSNRTCVRCGTEAIALNSYRQCINCIEAERFYLCRADLERDLEFLELRERIRIQYVEM
jgi:hypothetical protein